MNKELLKNVGVDYEAGLNRFLNDSELYRAVLAAFVSDDVLERARQFYRSKDRDGLSKVAHEAKGSSGNASLTNIYTEASALVALLRRDSCGEDELDEVFRRFETSYASVRDGIKAALES